MENNTNPTTEVKEPINAAENAEQNNTENTENGANAQNPAKKPETAEKTFTQAELNDILDKRFARFMKDEEAKLAKAREEGKNEAEALAKMTDEQRLKHEQEARDEEYRKRTEELSKREKEINMRELRSAALENLASRGLPKTLIDIVDLSDADKCNASIQRIENTFRTAVQDGVDSKLKNNAAPVRMGGATPALEKMTDDEYYASVYGGKK